MTEKQLPWPYNLPIWRSFYRATSPDGRRVAQIDPALERGMSNPTSGLLCVTSGPHIERCSPSFVWSDDSRYLAVPQFSGFLGRARLLVVSFEEKGVFASKITAWHFQPETFSGGQLLLKVNPHRATTSVMTFNIPSELSARFTRLRWHLARWPRDF